MGAVADAVFIKQLDERVGRLEEIVAMLGKPRKRRKYKKRVKATVHHLHQIGEVHG